MKYVASPTDGWMMVAILNDIVRRPPTWQQLYDIFPNVPHEHVQTLVRLGITEGILREVRDANGNWRIDWSVKTKTKQKSK